MKKGIRLILLVVLLSGSDLPGKPEPANKFKLTTEIMDFTKLYAKNCAGCHGKNGNMGPAPPLNDAVFLAIVPETELVKVINEGRKGTEMPAFALAQGGTMTADQIQVLAAGLRKKWGDAGVAKKQWPDYLLPAENGDVDRGKVVFARVCAGCHGQDGHIKPYYGVINAPAFLTLASEQVLRRVVITGRKDLGMPNCADHEGGPLASGEINDLVALLMSWKQQGTEKK